MMGSFKIQVADDVYRIVAPTGEEGEFVDTDSVATVNVRGVRYAALDGIDGDVFRCSVERTEHEDVEIQVDCEDDEETEEEEEG